ncbi:hypothetical protein DFP72DRAFT_1082771 [Ephemerocybe angulata]|uniref:Uncharacterized protein n=1 Tax=Ephemerocybe angulata TaxID=980116 RepID=A0A8H6LTF5_9AGAR|nr:hypothetical protein DFP72DRAFT_1082771 [Tulosesus angulatus]
MVKRGGDHPAKKKRKAAEGSCLGTKRKGKAKAKPVAAEGDEAGEAGIETSSTTKRKTAPRKKAGAAKGGGRRRLRHLMNRDDDSGSEFDELEMGRLMSGFLLKLNLDHAQKPRPLKRPLEKSLEWDAGIEPE